MDSATKAAISLLPKEAQEYTQGMYNTIEDVYGVNPMDLVNKGNLLEGLSTLLWKQMIGEKPDELAKEVMKTAKMHYYYPPGYSVDARVDIGKLEGSIDVLDWWENYKQSAIKQVEDENNYAISLLDAYQNQYGLVTDKGVEIIKDMIRNNLFSQSFQEARKYIQNIEPGDEFDFKWDLGKGSSDADITDIIHAIHGTDYNRQKENK